MLAHAAHGTIPVAMRRLLLLVTLLALAACGGRGRLAYGPGLSSYPEPGPPGDPWRPYIREASNRFSVPQRWIRAVMRRESGGHEYRHGRPITSSAGAMGLMQLMPATYADMQQRNGLGSDPYEPHDNILAGTAYIRLMYGRYGNPAFLAAYNAGPQRLDDYLASGRRLPNETADYVASIAPRLGVEVAAADPRPAPLYTAPVRLVAYRQPIQARSIPIPALPAVRTAPPAYGIWAIQVGAYTSTGQAHFAATMAREAAYAQLSGSRGLVQPTSRFGGTVLYRARLEGLAHEDAGAACKALEQHGIPCMIVPPGG